MKNVLKLWKKFNKKFLRHWLLNYWFKSSLVYGLIKLVKCQEKWLKHDLWKNFNIIKNYENIFFS